MPIITLIFSKTTQTQHMKETFKKLIKDFHNAKLPPLIKRQLQLPDLPKAIRKAIVLIGMRRVGKTYMLYQDMLNQLAIGTDKSKMLYINFEDDRLLSMKAENFQAIIDAYFELYPQYLDAEDLIFYFDEIHNVENWEKFIRRLLDKEKMQIFVTGSSAKLLSHEIATSLRGRCVTREIFPLNIKEILAFYDFELSSNLDSKQTIKLQHYIDKYLLCGGFQEIVTTELSNHREIIQDYINAAVYRDIIDRYKIKNAYVVKLFLNHCLQNIATNLSITKVYNSFKSNGEVVGKNSLFEYLDHFTDAYLIYSIPIFNYSSRKRQVNPPKIYTTDVGIIYAFSIKPETEAAAAFENTVFIALRQNSKEIHYYKTANNKEIDFVIRDENGKLNLYQACVDISDDKTFTRETQALVEASNELKTDNLFLVTPNKEEKILIDDKEIFIIPFWKLKYTQSS